MRQRGPLARQHRCRASHLHICAHPITLLGCMQRGQWRGVCSESRLRVWWPDGGGRAAAVWRGPPEEPTPRKFNRNEAKPIVSCAAHRIVKFLHL